MKTNLIKTNLKKVLLTLGCAASIAVVSGQALACVCRHGCPPEYTYKCDGYYRFYGYRSDFQCRPVIVVYGSYVFVQKCTSGYWRHQVSRRPCCS